MHARVVTFQGSPDKMQDPGSNFREGVLPILQQQDGFKGATVLFDRAHGKLLGISLWESDQAAEAAMRVMDPIRSENAARMGTSAPPSELFEVVYTG